MRVRGRAVGSIGVALVLVAFAAPAALAADHEVTIKGFAFAPGVVTVSEGDTVTWTNRDGASHTATANDGSFDTGGIRSTSTDTVRFTTAGEFRYHCSIHPDMTGRVVVQAASTGTAATPPATDARRGASDGAPTPALPTLAFALIALAGLSGALGWRLRRTTGR